MNLTAEESFLLNGIATRLGVSFGDLQSLINFESGFKPDAKNPYSSARGLIQFTDATARSLGFNDSLDLITKCPTVALQLPVVEKYLKQFVPYTDKQSLYLAVFYPDYRKKPIETMFPEYVRAVNPGIDTVQDYIDLVDRKKKVMS